jgi:hypothetical protein
MANDPAIRISADANATTAAPRVVQPVHEVESGIGTQQAASGFKEGVNVHAASAMYAMDGRFSNYDAVLQSLDTCEDVGDSGNLIASIVDPTVPRFRYRAIVAEAVQGGPDVAAQRANWEMASRYGRSFQVRLTTDTWRDSAGKVVDAKHTGQHRFAELETEAANVADLGCDLQAWSGRHDGGSRHHAAGSLLSGADHP